MKTKSKSGFERYDYILSGIKSSEPLSVKQIKSIFLMLLNDYFQNEVDDYFLESLAGDLYFNFSKSPNYIKSKDPNLSYALDCASDITYFIKRHGIKNKKRAETIVEELKDYYTKNYN